MDAVGAPVPGFAPGTAATAALAGLCDRLRTDLGDRYGRDDGDFQPGEYSVAAAAAVSELGPPGVGEPVSQQDHSLPGVAQESMSYPDYFDWRVENHTLDGIASYAGATGTLD